MIKVNVFNNLTTMIDWLCKKIYIECVYKFLKNACCIYEISYETEMSPQPQLTGFWPTTAGQKVRKDDEKEAAEAKGFD